MRRPARWVATSDRGKFARRVSLPAIVRWAADEAAFGRTRVAITRDGRYVGELTAAMIWAHVMDPRLADAIARFEAEGR